MLKKNIYLKLSILVMILIFIMSSIPINTSDKISKDIVISIFEFSNRSLENNNLLNSLNYIIRKLAHIFSYMILSILLYMHFLKQNISMKKTIRLVMVISIIFAISDEFHQTYVPGRMGQFGDVLRDTIGILIGILIMRIKNNYFS